MRSISKKIIGIIVIFCVVLSFILILDNSKYVKEYKIKKVLESEYYSYLPEEAKEYVKEIYDETGEIILTEKNKVTNELYLNPRYVDYLTSSDEEKKNFGEIPISTIIDYVSRKEAETISVPSKYDMREKYVTPVRNQGNLGICWTFATAGVVESFLIQNTEDSTIDNPKLISERQIDYATSVNGIVDYESEYVSFVSRFLGDGGNFYISTISMANGISLFNYNNFKAYDDSDLSKMEIKDVLNYENSEYEINSTINVPSMNLRESTYELTEEEKETRKNYLNEVKQNIMKNGGAYVGTLMGKNSSCTYVDSNLNNMVIDVYGCDSTNGHAMQIIGWDDDIEYSYCADTSSHKADISNCKNIVNGKGVWILKNSWGENTQYPYLTYDSLYSSIHFINGITKSVDKTWNNNYVLREGTENIKEKVYYLKDTSIKGNEKINKVKFITQASDTEYLVKVLDKNGNYSTYTETSKLPGLMTIEITDDIIVDKDTEITISSKKGYIDKVSIFTSNIDKTPYVDLSKYDNKSIYDNEIRLYSLTKNISSNTELLYTLYDSNDQEVVNGVKFINNVVAENNVNTLMEISGELNSGNYKLNVTYNSSVIATANFKIVKMSGTGTEENPYIITNSNQLNQIRYDLDAYYVLANDIDLTEATQTGGQLSKKTIACTQGFGWESINDFSGTLDGKGHKIIGLHQNNYISCDKATEWNDNGNGLFGTIYGNVTIKNLVLENFNINCQGGNCGVLVSKYEDNNGNSNDKNVYKATFENIALINSNVSGVYNKKNTKSEYSYGGSLLGMITSINGSISVSNIYLDYKKESQGISGSSYLIYYLIGNDVNVHDIQVMGEINGKYEDGSGEAVLIYKKYDSSEIKNILSTVTGKNVETFIGGSSETSINNVNALKINNTLLCKNCLNIKNSNLFDINTEIYKLTDKSNYFTWDNFNDNWVMNTIGDIPRMPVLKFIDFKYTKINNISINQQLNKHFKIFDFIEPDIDSAKRIIYKSNNEDIVKLDENGTIIPQSTGNTTIHVESYYDGYIKDVPISVIYKPHYTIHFNSNDTEDYYSDINGTMNSVEVEVGESYVLPANKFTQEYYEFKEWNTKPDGTGISYSDLAEIPAMNDKDELTLYAQWWGKERIVTFDADGGEVSPKEKIVRIRSEYGELPIPKRNGYGFSHWFSSAIYINAFSILSELELKARWITDAYTIVYDANGGILQEKFKNDNNVYLASDTLATTYAKNGEEKIVYENIYEKSGYKFKEWNTKSDGTGTSYSVNDILKLSNVEDDTFKLYAIWEELKYSVIFDANDGLFKNNKSQIIIEDWKDSKIKNLETPTRDGYIFKGFYTEKSSGVLLENFIENTGIKQEGLIFYAQWENMKFTLNFNSNGGTGSMKSQEFAYDISQNISKNIYEKSGYKFKEWNTKKDGTGTSYKDGQEIKLTNNLTLYAIWEESYKYVIKSYKVDEGKKYIDKIEINTILEQFKKNIDLNVGYSVNVDYKTINGKNLIYTGGKTKIYDSSYKLVTEYSHIIRGDVNGDGKLNYLDYVNVYNHIQKMKHPKSTKKALVNEFLISADMSDDGKVNYLDYVKIYNKIKELKGGN